jgi:hypothetical protein
MDDLRERIANFWNSSKNQVAMLSEKETIGHRIAGTHCDGQKPAPTDLCGSGWDWDVLKKGGVFVNYFCTSRRGGTA